MISLRSLRNINWRTSTARIGKTQQKSRCRLCGDRDETINHIRSECNKLAQRESKRLDKIG